MMMNALLAIALCVILLILNSLLAKKIIFDREKISPFECGFEPKNSARLPFSLRFYMVAVIFLIFDVEITLILPIPVSFQFMAVNSSVCITLFFVLILLLGLFHEWNEGALEWKN